MCRCVCRCIDVSCTVQQLCLVFGKRDRYVIVVADIVFGAAVRYRSVFSPLHGVLLLLLLLLNWQRGQLELLRLCPLLWHKLLLLLLLLLLRLLNSSSRGLLELSPLLLLELLLLRQLLLLLLLRGDRQLLLLRLLLLLLELLSLLRLTALSLMKLLRLLLLLLLASLLLRCRGGSGLRLLWHVLFAVVFVGRQVVR